VGQVEDPTEEGPEEQGEDGAGGVEETDPALRGAELAEIPREMNEQGERELLEQSRGEQTREVGAEAIGRHGESIKVTGVGILLDGRYG
jgi:hypothetical protein